MSQDVPVHCPKVIEITKRWISYPSAAGDVNINAIAWEPIFEDEDDHPRGIVQIVHGMIEHIDRYDWYARQLAAEGFVVVGNDHVGHGDSVRSQEDWGYIPMDGGDEILVEDVQRLRHHIQGDYDESIPYFIHGHSMGSFITRLYISRYAAGLSGAIIEGTGNPASALSAFGRFLTKVISRFRGERYKSKLVDNMAVGGYAKKIENARTRYDWLSLDEQVVDSYAADPKCSFMFSVAAYHTLLTLTGKVVNPKVISRVPKTLSILVASGKGDPVGGSNAAGPKQVYRDYRHSGIEDVELKVYDNARHELHNELIKEEFVQDVLEWLGEHLDSRVAL